MRRRFEFDNNSIKIPSKNGVYYFLRDGPIGRRGNKFCITTRIS